jgi:enamine deaminase RidA (YjgF/YER057c/UK114 family)
MRQNLSSGSPFEPQASFSRVVRIDPFLAVAGTAPIAVDGGVTAPGDVYGQTKRCLEIIGQVITAAGMSVESVIRTRVMLTDITRWSEAARAHGEVFGAIKPPAWLVELEADYVVLYSSQNEKRSSVSNVIEYVSQAKDEQECRGDKACYDPTFRNGIRRRTICFNLLEKRYTRAAENATWPCMPSAAGKAMRRAGRKRSVAPTKP